MESENFDDFDEFLFNEFNENFTIPNIVEKCIDDTLISIRNENLNKKYIISNIIKKVIILITSAITIFGGYCFARYVINNYFYPTKNGIETAATNGYIYNPNMEYVDSNGNKLKITNLLMDDYTLNISFDINLNNIDISTIENFSFKNIIISDDLNNILYVSDENILNDYKKENSLDLKDEYMNSNINWYIQNKNLENNIITIVYNFTPSGLNKYPNSKNLKIYLNNLELSENSREIDGTWILDINLPEYFYNRTNISYKAINNSTEFNIKDFGVYNSGSKLIMEFPKTSEIISDEEFKKLNEQFLKESAIKNEILKENPNAIIEPSETKKKLLEIVQNQSSIYHNIYIENTNGQKFYPSYYFSENSGSYEIDNDTLYYWNTFNLTEKDLTDKLILHIENDNNEVQIELEKN